MKRLFRPRQVRSKLIGTLAVGSVGLTTAIVLASIGSSGGLESEPGTNLRQRLLSGTTHLIQVRDSVYGASDAAARMGIPDAVARAEGLRIELARVESLRVAEVGSGPVAPAADAVRIDGGRAKIARVDGVAGDGPSAQLQSAASAANGRTPPANPGVDLGSAERIHLRVRGNSELTGEYRVNPDLTISINGIGRVSVRSITASDFEAQLADKLSSDLRRDVSVAVEISRFRPFFVTGQVSQPGAVEWRPDLSLIQAISLSGGIVRTNAAAAANADTPERALVQQQARAQLRFAQAQLARLRAERDGKETVVANRAIDSVFSGISREGRQAVEDFMGRQNAMLSEQRALLQSRITRLERERDAANGELEAAQQQISEVKQQVELSREMMQGIEQLKNQKLLPNQRYLAQRRELVDTRVRYSEARVALERIRGRVSSLTRDIEAVHQERRALLNERIETLEREVVQLEITLSDSGHEPRNEQEGGVAVNYHIARKSAAGVQTIAANLFTEIYPGDVVIVSSQQRSRSAATTSASRGTPGVATAASGALERTQQIMESSAGQAPMFGRLIPARIGAGN